MPTPHVVQPNVPPGATPRTGIFVSYSHDDLEGYARPFLKHLNTMVQSHASLGFSTSDIFFDRNNLKAGYEWDELIQRALESSRVLIFLISVNSLQSDYCLNKELAHAFQAGDQVRTFFVLIRSCSWTGIPAPSDPKGRRLGDLEVVPRQGSGREDLLPVELWPSSKDDAFTKAVEGIAAALADDSRLSPNADRRIPALPACFLPRIAPYRCNQDTIVSEFSTGLRQWSQGSAVQGANQALAVFLRGVPEDHLSQFWTRLHQNELVDWVTQKHRHRINDDKPLALPFGEAGGRQPDLRPELLRKLSEALTGSAYKIESVEDLARYVRGLSAIQPLSVTLPHKDTTACIGSLQVLFGLLEECPPDVPLRWLVFAFRFEGTPRTGGGILRRLMTRIRPPTSEAEGQADTLSLALPRLRLQRTVLVNLSPLRALERTAIRQWYDLERLGERVDDDADTLAQKVLAGQSSIRFAAFVKGLRSHYPLFH